MCIWADVTQVTGAQLEFVPSATAIQQLGWKPSQTVCNLVCKWVLATGNSTFSGDGVQFLPLLWKAAGAAYPIEEPAPDQREELRHLHEQETCKEVVNNRGCSSDSPFYNPTNDSSNEEHEQRSFLNINKSCVLFPRMVVECFRNVWQIRFEPGDYGKHDHEGEPKNPQPHWLLVVELYHESYKKNRYKHKEEQEESVAPGYPLCDPSCATGAREEHRRGFFGAGKIQRQQCM
mmetsp:Transcript_49426/g.77231  ORF Transcript_49426/g.77231 Transcript_49426/m.77231 type:complete len:233 (+) Transcript_49426:76-774(+)